jgi:geranylgeranyl diphosphate synthase, type II
MDTNKRIEQALEAIVARADAPGAPPKLAAAARHAVFPAGARIRPKLCLAVALACGDDDPCLSNAAAISIELMHCASLVHDDLPCFDDAPLRRGRPSVHTAYGERTAVLAGDALIVLAFQALGDAANTSKRHTAPLRLAPLLVLLAQRVGLPHGIAAGQAWESEDYVALPDYQRAKTGSLFAAATEMGAIAAGAAPATWSDFGQRLGEAYQVADDIRDVVASAQEIGKPVGRDRALSRPNAVAEMGLTDAVRHFCQLRDHAASAIPACPGAKMLRAMVTAESQRLLPSGLGAALAQDARRAA